MAGNAADATQNFLAREQLYRQGFAIEMVAFVCNIPCAPFFYDWCKVVNRSLSLPVVSFTLAGAAIESFGLLCPPPVDCADMGTDEIWDSVYKLQGCGKLAARPARKQNFAKFCWKPTLRMTA